MQRLNQIARQLTGTSGGPVEALQVKNPEDVVIVMAARSPLCKSKKGLFKDMRTDELMTSMFKATMQKLPCDPALVTDVCVGIVQGSGNAYYARAAALAAGFPETTSVQTVNRFCSSGLMALSIVANQIRNNEIEVGLAMGVENLSSPTPVDGMSDEIAAHPIAKDCIMPMGWTSENVAEDFSIPRERMDEFAARSHQRAERAQATGIFKEEIVPIEAFVRQPGVDKDAPRQRVIVTEDDGIRKGTTPASLAKVRSAFPQWGQGKTTGGNASQITDGAAVVLLMRRSKADELGLKILGKHVATAVHGLAPRIMGIGPYYAIPKVLGLCGLTTQDVDLFEINEAFASMYVYCVENLGLDPEKVNVNGGAIGLGHPFGMTGVRQVVTGLPELNRRKGRVLVTSMCIGTGMGAAAVFIGE